MDNSSVLVDNSQFRLKIGEVIETSVGIIERGTLNVFKELNKMREEYSGMINKFLEFCDKENINTDVWEGGENSKTNLRTHSNENDRNDGRSFINRNKQYRFPTLELKKIKLEKLIENKSKYYNSTVHTTPDIASTNKTHVSHHSHFIGSKNSPISSSSVTRGVNKNGRSKTPVGKNSSSANRPSGSSSNTLQEVSLNWKNLPKITDTKAMRINTNNNINHSSNTNIFSLNTNLAQSTLNTLNAKQNNNASIFHLKSETPKKLNTPNHYKIDLKNFLSHNTKSISGKKIAPPKSLMEKQEKFSPDFKMNYKEKNRMGKIKNTSSSSINSNNLSSISINTGNADNVNVVSNVLSTPKSQPGRNLNINVGNVNINVNNNINNKRSSNNKVPGNGNNNLNVKRGVDDRKLSILDIAGGGPLILENNDLNKLLSLAPVRKSAFNKIFVKGLSSNMSKFIYIFAHSDIVPIETRLIFSRLNRKVYSEYPPHDVIKDYFCFLNNRVSELENIILNYKMNPQLERRISKPFIPSKTAQNNLNFITREDMINMGKDDFGKTPEQQSDSEVIRNIYRVIYILLNKNYEKLNPNHLASNLFYKIFVEMEVKSLSKFRNLLKTLFLNIICQNLNLSNEQHSQFTILVEKNKAILNPPLIYKLNKALSFVCFIIKEIYEYITMKTQDGLLIFHFKKQKSELKKINEKLEKLKNLVQ